jgi:hypothetical protein
MKNHLFIILLLGAFYAGNAQESSPNPENVLIPITRYDQDQQTMIKLVANYFRSNPYNRFFNSFLNHLMNDPMIINKQIEKRTDTSLFFFKGEYKNFNPFFYTPSRIEVTLTETVVIVNDSTQQLDTVITYQLAGYSKNNKAAESDVKDEFSKFQRRIKKKFWSAEATPLRSGNADLGQLQNYFILPYPLSPVSAAWGKIESSDEFVFAIIVRMKIIENVASLP